jgi:hypothetical protein
MATIGYKELCAGEGHLYSSWARQDFLLYYYPEQTTKAKTHLIERGFGIFYWLTAEDAFGVASPQNQVWKVEIGEVMPLPKKILASPFYIQELDEDFWSLPTALYRGRWGMTNKVTLIERIK